jgi:hypothetical protein
MPPFGRIKRSCHPARAPALFSMLLVLRPNLYPSTLEIVSLLGSLPNRRCASDMALFTSYASLVLAATVKRSALLLGGF